MMRHETKTTEVKENPQQASSSNNERSASTDLGLYGGSSRGGRSATDTRPERSQHSDSENSGSEKFFDAVEDPQEEQRPRVETERERGEGSTSRGGRGNMGGMLYKETERPTRSSQDSTPDLGDQDRRSTGIEAYPLGETRGSRGGSREMGGMNDMLYGRMGRGFTDSASDLGRLKLTERSDVDRGKGSSRVQDLSSRRDEAPEITPVAKGKAPEITPVTERGERDLERGDRVPDAERVANDLAQIIENMSEREAREAVADTVAAALQQKAEAKGEIIRDKDVQTLKESADGAVKDFERRNMSWFNKKKEGAKDTFRTLTWKKVLVGSLYLLRDVGIGGANSAVTMIAEHKFDGGLLGSSIGGSVFANRGLDAFGKFGGPIAQTAFGQGLNIGVLAGEGKFASNTSEAANTTHTNHTEYANMTRRANDDSLNLEDVWSNLNKKMGGDVDNAKTLLQNTGVITDID